MDRATVYRIISLIPERAPWMPSGSTFAPEGKSERVALIARLQHWLSPLDALSMENQQFLGLRANGARPADAEAEDGEITDDVDEPATPVRLPGAGTQIAA